MKRFAPGRLTVLIAVLAVLGAFVVLDARRDEPTAKSATRELAKTEPSERPGAARAASADAPRLHGALVIPERPALSEPRGELFGQQSWQPPAPKIAAAASAPVPPPNPYRFAGKLLLDGALQVLLSKGDRVFPVKPGETLDGGYRVEAIGETQITLLYLPLNHRESIPVNSALETTAPIAQSSSPPAASAQAAAGANTESAVVSKGVAQPARLAWEGPQQVKIGAPFDVALRVTSDQPVQGSPMQLRFDPGVLEPLAVKPGRFFVGAGRNFSYRVNPGGSIFVGASGRPAAAAGGAELLVLTFKPVKSAAAAELSIASLDLHGPAGKPIAFERLATYTTIVTP